LFISPLEIFIFEINKQAYFFAYWKNNQRRKKQNFDFLFLYFFAPQNKGFRDEKKKKSGQTKIEFYFKKIGKLSERNKVRR